MGADNGPLADMHTPWPSAIDPGSGVDATGFMDVHAPYAGLDPMAKTSAKPRQKRAANLVHTVVNPGFSAKTNGSVVYCMFGLALRPNRERNECSREN